MNDFKFYFVTWNVGTSSPEEIDLHELLKLNPNNVDNYDFYFIGLQEVKSGPSNMLVDSLFDDPWTTELKSILAKYDYVKVKTIRLLGIMLNMFCQRKHLENIRDLEKTYTRTGFNGLWGNKGAVSIRFEINGCSICIVNSHLSAHDEYLNDRIEDYNSILKDQEFHVKDTINIMFHDYVFWLGDLNFRLMEEINLAPCEIAEKIEKDGYKELFEKDQLRHVQRTGEAFGELKENSPDFPPTFKYEVGTCEYDLKRRPAWCDRILYKVVSNNYENITLQATQKFYECHSQYSISDHKPVSALFNVKVFCDKSEQTAEFDVIPVWYLDEDCQVTVHITGDVKVTDNDWVAIYKDGFTDFDEYVSYVYVKKGSPVPERRNAHDGRQKYTVNFPDSIIGTVGKYVLVYVHETEDNVQSILGISEPFNIQIRSDE